MHFGPLVWATLLAMSLVVPAAAAAELSETDVEQRRQDAAQRYERGAQAYQEGRHKDAIDLFLEADALAPSSALSYNIARAYEKIKDSSNALHWYRDYLRREPNAEDKDEVGELIEQYERALQDKGVQQITVLSEPAMATVRIDGRPVGVTPWTGDLPPGEHRVLLSLRGYADSQRDITLAADASMDVNFRLLPAVEAPEPPAHAGITERQARASSKPPQADAAPSGPTTIGVVTYVALGTGVATLATAGVFEWLRRSAEEDAKQAGVSQLEFVDARDSAEQHQTTARVLVGVGGALTLVGGVLLALDLSRASSSSAQRQAPQQRALAASALCTGADCFVSLQGSF